MGAEIVFENFSFDPTRRPTLCERGSIHDGYWNLQACISYSEKQRD
jgi:hypothetical protein